MKTRSVAAMSVLLVLIAFFAMTTTWGTQTAVGAYEMRHMRASSYSSPFVSAVTFSENRSQQPTLTLMVNITFGLEITQVTLVYSTDNGATSENAPMQLLKRSISGSTNSSIWSATVSTPSTSYQLTSRLLIVDSKGTNWQESLDPYSGGSLTSTNNPAQLGSSIALMVVLVASIIIALGAYLRYRRPRTGA